MLCFKGDRRLSTKMETPFKNCYTYAFSNYVVKVCEMFMCPHYKQHAINNIRPCFLIAPNIQRDSIRLNQFRTSIFSELYMVCE